MQCLLDEIMSMNIRQIIRAGLNELEHEAIEQEGSTRNLLTDVANLQLKSGDPDFSSTNPRYKQTYNVIE